MTAKVILNPYAGRWKGRQNQPALEHALHEHGVDFVLAATEAPNHGIELARQAVLDGYAPVIAAGGDGSVSEVMNGIVAAAQEANTAPVALGILPLGSANDLVINLGMPLDLAGAARAIAEGAAQRIDLGVVTAWEARGQEKRTRYFDNNSAIGLEPSITLIQQRIPWLRGSLRYILAALVGVMKNPQWTMQLTWDGGEYQGPATLVTAGNNPLTGGVFFMTPHADPFDGKLDCVYGYVAARLQILRLLPHTMKSGAGSYVEHPAIHEVRLERMKIHTDQPTPVHVDGEILFEAAQDIEYRILPGYLPVLMHGRARAS